MPGWRLLAAAAALSGYAALSHWLMVHAPDRPWTVAAMFGPLVAGIALAGLKRRHAPTLLLAALIGVALVVAVARGGVADLSRLYVLQHGAIHLALGWTFLMTLRPGATAFISAIAERVHTVFTPEMRAYTRWLTGLWAAYFFAMVAVSALLYTFAPWAWWSLFCNVFTPLSALTLAVVEHQWRYRRHPEFERASLAQALRAYRTAGTAHAR